MSRLTFLSGMYCWPQLLLQIISRWFCFVPAKVPRNRCWRVIFLISTPRILQVFFSESVDNILCCRCRFKILTMKILFTCIISVIFYLIHGFILIKVFIGSRSTLLLYLDNYGYKYVSKLKWTQYAEAQLNVTLLYISKYYVNFVLFDSHHSMHIIIANTLCLKISAAWSMAGRSQFTTRPGRRVW